MHEGERGGEVAGGDTGTTHLLAWVEGDESGGSRWWVDCRARLIVSFSEAWTTSTKCGGDPSEARSLAGWVEAGMKATCRRKLAEGPYLSLLRRGCK